MHPFGPELREKTMQILQNAFKIVRDADGAVVISDESLNDFLHEVKPSGLSRSQSLIALAYALGHELGWRQTCTIYESILAAEPEGEHSGTYETWLVLSLDGFMLESSLLTLEDRLEVAEQTLSILNRALKDAPKSESVAVFFGLYYYRHPLRLTAQKDYLSQSLKWFEIASEWDTSSEEERDVLTPLYIGHCNFGLSQWEKALTSYDTLDVEQVREEEGEAAVTELLSNAERCRAELK